MKKNRAFLKWAGGKFPLLDDIKKHLPEGECLIEPFVGAGSVFLNTDFSRYILADINSDLIGLYNIVKLRTDEYVAAAREMFTPENNVAERYYLYRDEFNQSQDPLRRAVLFLYLNRHGYNGLCRYNLRGEFNVPFGRYKKPYFPEAELYHFAEKAQNAEFYCESYEECMQRADSRTSGVLRSALCAANGDGELYRLPHQQFQPGTTGTAGAKGGIADEKAHPGADFQPPHAADAGMV
ncbi:methyl-directed repair DNA adenine methylase [Klebsiella pneumoniae]|uniref:DNA adenine methylase n=1 Tax=Klebsiella pneumoniae TaxID=573 RepID=A0A2X3CPM4_KLEPN|nr:methyl-directed repair DNA adenine methylase [Klebsiella pneumoniae]